MGGARARVGVGRRRRMEKLHQSQRPSGELQPRSLGGLGWKRSILGHKRGSLGQKFIILGQKRVFWGRRGRRGSGAGGPDPAVAPQDGQAMLWDLNEGKHLYTLDGGDIINALCFSPNRYWLCAATGPSIKIWVRPPGAPPGGLWWPRWGGYRGLCGGFVVVVEEGWWLWRGSWWLRCLRKSS